MFQKPSTLRVRYIDSTDPEWMFSNLTFPYQHAVQISYRCDQWTKDRNSTFLRRAEVSKVIKTRMSIPETPGKEVTSTHHHKPTRRKPELTKLNVSIPSYYTADPWEEDWRTELVL